MGDFCDASGKNWLLVCDTTEVKAKRKVGETLVQVREAREEAGVIGGNPHHHRSSDALTPKSLKHTFCAQTVRARNLKFLEMICILYQSKVIQNHFEIALLV